VERAWSACAWSVRGVRVRERDKDAKKDTSYDAWEREKDRESRTSQTHTLAHTHTHTLVADNSAVLQPVLQWGGSPAGLRPVCGSACEVCVCDVCYIECMCVMRVCASVRLRVYVFVLVCACARMCIRV
jgi:hypothetical protein